MGDLLTLETSLDRPEIAARAAETDLRCQVRMQASPELLQSAATPVSTHLCLAFDCSGSMIGRKILAAIEAGKMIVDMLGDQHSLSLVLFQSRADLLIDNAPMTSDRKDATKKEVDDVRLFLGGSTNLAAGIQEGATALKRSIADAKVMVILTDGEADDPKESEQAAAEASAADPALRGRGG